MPKTSLKLAVISILLLSLGITYCENYEKIVYNFANGTLSPDLISESGNWAISKGSSGIDKFSLTTGEVLCPQYANISLNASGPGYLKFDWKISGALTLMELYIDNRSHAVCRSYDWQSYNMYIPTGFHPIKWVLKFKKVNDKCIPGSKGSGWLCNVVVPGVLKNHLDSDIMSQYNNKSEKDEALKYEIYADVTPNNGTIYTPFTYRFNAASAPYNEFDIELQIRPPGSNIWVSEGIQNFNISAHKELLWENLSFLNSPIYLGAGKFRFLIGNQVIGEFSGPNVDVVVRNESFIKRPDYNFDYSAEVKSSRPEVDMELQYTDDGIIWVKSGLIRTYRLGNNSSSQAPWINLIWQDQPWHYTIRVDERRI